ncbi:MAG: hypothetical protein JRH20_07630 [Deltaproteobacteria bacterium]|nr:hypothetical protein [Deltaproteobacteria bacterium]
MMAPSQQKPQRNQHEDLRNLLAALVEQMRAMASRMAGSPERETTCHFCASGVQLWESLLVMQLAGVPSHIQCPPRILAEKLAEQGPVQDFPYDEFSVAVDTRLTKDPMVVAAGEIVA